VLAQRKTSILAVSTALDDENFFSGLTQLVDPDTGKLIFNVCRIGQICKTCAASETPTACTHKNYLLPAWKSTTKTKRMKAFYGAGQDHVYAREILGEIASGARGAYNAKLLARVRALPRYAMRAAPRALYFGIDPGGGGPGEMGCAVMADFDGTFVVRSRNHFSSCLDGGLRPPPSRGKSLTQKSMPITQPSIFCVKDLPYLDRARSALSRCEEKWLFYLGGARRAATIALAESGGA
jgi:hypothetical protein